MGRLGWIGVGLAGLFLATFALGAATGFLQQEQVEGWVAALSDSPWGRLRLAGLFFALLAADVVLATPATLVMLAAGETLGPWVGGAVSAAGTMAAATIGYAACRWGGRVAARRWIGDGERRRARRAFGRFGLLAIVVARGLPILPEALACIGGLARLPAGRFLGAFAAATVPWAMIHAWAGHASSWANPWPAILVLIGLPAAAWSLWRAYRPSRARSASSRRGCVNR